MRPRRCLPGLRRAARRRAPSAASRPAPGCSARAGLLEGRAATTHWEDLEEFAAAFPGADVRPDRYVIDGPVFTAGGASPTFDLMLHLIRSRLGMAVALDVASVFIYDEAHAATDAQPLVSLGRLDGASRGSPQAIRLMEAHVDQPLTVAAIARRVGVSARTLETHVPPVDRRDARRLLSAAAARRRRAGWSSTPRADGRHRGAHRLLLGRGVLAGVFAVLRQASDRVAPLLTLSAVGAIGLYHSDTTKEASLPWPPQSSS